MYWSTSSRQTYSRKNMQIKTVVFGASGMVGEGCCTSSSLILTKDAEAEEALLPDTHAIQ